MNRKKNTQKKLVNELKNQLMIQAERLGIKEDYSLLFMEELKLDSVKKILTEFYMERANLEYEMQLAGSAKKEIMIKLEKLNAYIRKAVGVQNKHLGVYGQILDAGIGDKELTQRAVKKLEPTKVRASA
jgi:hypothetical protein